MRNPFQFKIPATYMRGGTSKGVFFKQADLPSWAQQPGAERDQTLLRVIGSPDPYGKHIDGMGGGTSSTSKVVIVSKSARQGHDVDYLFGQVAIDQPLIDWSGNCGNLTAAVGVFALNSGLISTDHSSEANIKSIRIWQVNTGKTIVVHIPMVGHEVQEVGEFFLDGVAFAAPEIKIDFVDPVIGDQLFPTGQVAESLSVPGIGTFDVTLINAGIPTVFLNAHALGYQGTELQQVINTDPIALERLERIRAQAALQMGLVSSIEAASASQHVPKIAFVAAPNTYTSSSGKIIDAQQIDLVVRALSMGKLHHAMMGTAAIAIGAAAAVSGTLVNQVIAGRGSDKIVFGHPSGTLAVDASVRCQKDVWQVDKVTMSRSARVLMSGFVSVPRLI